MSEKVYLVFDIETAVIPYESFSASQQEYLVRGAVTEEEIERKKAEMGLTPLTAQVATIGMKIVPFSQLEKEEEKLYELLNEEIYAVRDSKEEYIDAENYDDTNPEKNENNISKTSDSLMDYSISQDILYDKNRESIESVTKNVALMLNPDLTDDDEPIITIQDDKTFYETSEKRLLETFWKTVDKYKGCVLMSFNGRNFDAPFLMIRSALLKVKPTRNLMEGTKFNYPQHIDLIDELTFYSPSGYGATKRYNFDFYTRAFGLVSPKSEGIDGSLVSVFFREGKYKTIADYCLRDVDATWKLFLRIKNYLTIK
ncbi:MAG: hypothetical protein A2X64_04615 [Ignavibacteria bacterium GWF2_33_9]|nr:MAG: hypothetical protein A2X64_04615 [Ignavibacteria bacterium GWF2_33_9]